MDDAFLGQMATLVIGQNKLMTRLAFAVKCAAVWSYALIAVGVLLGFREWNSLFLTAATFPAKSAFVATLGEVTWIKGLVVADSILCCVTLFMRSRLCYLLHGALSVVVVYYFSSLWESGSVSKPAFSLVLASMLPLSLLVIDKIIATVQEMEKGLSRLLLVGRELDDTKID